MYIIFQIYASWWVRTIRLYFKKLFFILSLEQIFSTTSKLINLRTLASTATFNVSFSKYIPKWSRDEECVTKSRWEVHHERLPIRNEKFVSFLELFEEMERRWHKWRISGQNVRHWAIHSCTFIPSFCFHLATKLVSLTNFRSWQSRSNKLDWIVQLCVDRVVSKFMIQSFPLININIC